MEQSCQLCEAKFEIREKDLQFYDKVSPVMNGKKYVIPPPKLCPSCRSQRRLAFRNERSLYHRKCDKTGETILSIYAPTSPFKVYKQELWWQDEGDPMTYGKAFDFDRGFFEQFAELMKVVPRPSLHVIGNENCDYVNQCGYSKDCYLTYNTDFSQNCYYSCNVLHSRDSLDLFNAEKCELCYGSVDLHNCYQVAGSTNCKDCNNLYFCHNLIGCSDCFGCTNLRNKKYCLYNKQLTEQDYKDKVKSLVNGSYADFQKYGAEANNIRLQQPHRYAEISQCENSTGNYLVQCKNAHDCFDSFSDEDIAYCTVTSTAKDTYDFDVGGYDCELCLENVSAGGKNYHCLFITNHWGNDYNTLYCDIMVKDKNCFGCIGLRNKEFCILNKQYSKEEYEALVPKIIEQMIQRGEWGEFFPASVSPFGYNETVAQEYFPLTREQVVGNADLRSLQNRLNWSDYEAPPPQVAKVVTQEQMKKLPDNIKDIPDDILNWALTCEVTGKPYKIIKQELKFYREHNLPVPRRHPDQRHKDRMALRNPRKLWNRTCMKCNKAIQTTYAPDRAEIVYCEECYLQEVY